MTSPPASAQSEPLKVFEKNISRLTLVITAPNPAAQEISAKFDTADRSQKTLFLAIAKELKGCVANSWLSEAWKVQVARSVGRHCACFPN
jgi:hypothetical protein